MKKPSRMPPASRRLREASVVSAALGCSTVTRSGWPWKPRASNDAARYSCPSASSSPCPAGRSRGSTFGTVVASDLAAAAHDDVQAGEAAHALGVGRRPHHRDLEPRDVLTAVAGHQAPRDRQRRVGRADVGQGARAAGEGRCASAPSLLRSSSARARIAVSSSSRSAAASCTSAATATATRSRPLADLGQGEVARDALRAGQPRLRLALLVVADEPEQHEGDRHHRDDDDEDEEQRQPVAEAHGAGWKRSDGTPAHESAATSVPVHSLATSGL